MQIIIALAVIALVSPVFIKKIRFHLAKFRALRLERESIKSNTNAMRAWRMHALRQAFASSINLTVPTIVVISIIPLFWLLGYMFLTGPQDSILKIFMAMGIYLLWFIFNPAALLLIALGICIFLSIYCSLWIIVSPKFARITGLAVIIAIVYALISVAHIANKQLW